MATLLKKIVRRKVEGVERGLVVSLYPGAVLGLRVSKTRTEYTLPLARVYRWAVEAAVDAKRREKAKGKPRLVSRGLLTTGRR